MTSFRDFEHAGWSDNSVAKSYHQHLGQVTVGCIPDLFDAARFKRGDRVLDVACGAGYVAAAAHDRGAEAVGVDLSASQVRLAEQTYPSIRFIEGDAEALPFADGEFAAVLNAFGLPHISNADKAAAEAHRVLKPGGRFAYASWCVASACIGFSMVYDAVRAHGSLDVGLPPGPIFFGYGDPHYAREMLGCAGFSEVSVKEVPLVWRAADPDAVIEGISRARCARRPSSTGRARTTLSRSSNTCGIGFLSSGKTALMRCRRRWWSRAASRADGIRARLFRSRPSPRRVGCTIPERCLRRSSGV